VYFRYVWFDGRSVVESGFSVIALAAAAVWLVLAFPLAGFYRRETREG